MITRFANHISFRRGIVYEGDKTTLWALDPIPTILAVKWQGFETERLVFRQDHIHPTGDIRTGELRTGRFYSLNGNQSLVRRHVDNIYNRSYGDLIGIQNGEFDEDDSGTILKMPDLNTAREYMITLGTLGTQPAASRWNVERVEQNIFEQHIFTLREHT